MSYRSHAGSLPGTGRTGSRANFSADGRCAIVHAHAGRLIRHPPRVERNDLVIEAVKARLTLFDELRLESPCAVARDFDRDHSLLALERLAGLAVAGITESLWPLRCLSPVGIPQRTSIYDSSPVELERYSQGNRT